MVRNPKPKNSKLDCVLESDLKPCASLPQARLGSTLVFDPVTLPAIVDFPKYIRSLFSAQNPVLP